MNGNQQRDPLGRHLFFTVRVVLGMVLFPVVTFLVVIGVNEVLLAVGLFQSHVEGGAAFVTIVGAIVGLAISAIVYGSPAVYSADLLILCAPSFQSQYTHASSSG